MATTTIVPTEETNNGLRLLSLVVDGGTLVLRHQFDRAIPPKDLAIKLGDPQVRAKLSRLQKSGKITTDQWRLLYPQVGQPDAAVFDVSLLTCLLRNICGLNDQSSSWKGIPSTMDTSLEADIQKLRLCRNKMCHLKSMSLSDQSFHQEWDEMEQVILRLGKDIPTLGHEIQNLKENSIDPKKERYYLEKLKGCDEEVDSVKTKITEVDNNVKDIKERLKSTETNQKYLELRHGELEQKLVDERVANDQKQKHMHERLSESETKTKTLEDKFAKLYEKTEEGNRRMSPE